MRTSRSTALFFALGLGLAVLGQCGPVISTFPYTEGFESVPAWTSGGIGDDWAWGTPAHPQINSAGGGAKSWCVGGLTGQFYEFDAQSWLMSPCFDFSLQSYLMVSFKLYWETERTYDGLGFQYSLDEGSTWENVGAFGDEDDCVDVNWFNASSVTNLDEASPKHGWSGRQGVTSGGCEGGMGSGGWVTASHCLAELLGESSVRFRFLFGSGSICNNFDGIAIDDIFIGEAPPPEVYTEFTCEGLSISYSATVDPCVTSYTWNFGDPGSGVSNTVYGPTADHVFSGPGTYMVSLTTTNICGGAHTGSGPITVVSVDLVATPASCGAQNGSLEAFVTGGNGPFTYDWEPGPEDSNILSGIAPGEYTLIVNANGGCPATVVGTVEDQASLLSVSIAHTDVSCGGSGDGTATAQVAGGVPISYAWAPEGGTDAIATDLPGGVYSVTVTDDVGCEASAEVTIAEAPVLALDIAPDHTLCDGASLLLEPTASGGTGAYVFTWSPDGPQIAPSQTTQYEVFVTDAVGCASGTASVTVNVGATPVPILTVDEPMGCAPQCVTFSPGPGGMASYSFDYGDATTGTDAVHCFLLGGVFDVLLTVTDVAGCSGSEVFEDIVHVFPSALAGFTSPSTVIITDSPLRIADASSGANNWQWDFGGASGDDTIPSPMVDFPAVGCYTLGQVVSNAFGCSDTARAEVCVENEFSLFAPNAFTPNGDGFNEIFGLVTSVRSPVFFVFRVFDRWGEEVFTTNDPNEGWSGAKAENGIYAWNVELRDSEDKLRKTSGHVVLIR